jgi:hypothetical protein
MNEAREAVVIAKMVCPGKDKPGSTVNGKQGERLDQRTRPLDIEEISERNNDGPRTPTGPRARMRDGRKGQGDHSGDTATFAA